MSHRVTIREIQVAPDRWVVDADFAHQLADELADAKERIEQLEGLLAGDHWIARKADQNLIDSPDDKALDKVLRIVEAKP